MGDKFKMFIQEKMKERVKQVVNTKKLNVMALPQFFDIFQKSNSILVQKGWSHYLIKACGKRKWGDVEKDDDELLRLTIREKNELNSTLAQIEKKTKWYKSQEGENFKNKDSLVKLYQQDIIDSDVELKE